MAHFIMQIVTSRNTTTASRTFQKRFSSSYLLEIFVTLFLPINFAHLLPHCLVLIVSKPPMATEPQTRRPMASFYSILGVSRGASVTEIRAAYRKLAMKWHPDRCGRERVQEANRRFQQIQEAYEVLSDEGRRALYDAGLYDPRNCEQDGVEDVEGFWDFVQEMVQLMAEVKNKQEDCTMEALHRMLAEMADGFSVPPMPTFHTSASTSTVDARARHIRWRAGGRGCSPVWFS